MVVVLELCYWKKFIPITLSFISEELEVLFQFLIDPLSLWKFQSLDEVKTLIYMEVYILSKLLSLEE